MTAVLEIIHETRYDYSAPVSLAHHLAHLQPLQDEHQHLLGFDLDIEPAPGLCAGARPVPAPDAFLRKLRPFGRLEVTQIHFSLMCD